MAGASLAGAVVGQGNWETRLQGRDLDGDRVADAFYDADLNITWLRNANVIGATDWGTARAWAASFALGGYDGWRLPTMVDTGVPGCNFSYQGGTDCGYNVDTHYSELAHLFYVTLGNWSFYAPGTGDPQDGSGLANTGEFLGLQAYVYWTDLSYLSTFDGVWVFNTLGGIQYSDAMDRTYFAIAVHPGDVGLSVPEPATYALLLAGIGAMGVFRRGR